MYLSRPKGQIVLDSFYLDEISKLDKRGRIFSGIIFIPRYFIYLISCGTRYSNETILNFRRTIQNLN